MHRIVFILASALFASSAADSAAQDDYKPGPDSLPQPGVPNGELIKGTYTAKEGSIFPGTEREYTIYLPPAGSGFGKTNPAPFMVFQDGIIYNAPVVFDNLIAKHDIPSLVGIFIKPGIVPAANPNVLPRYNRSYEYDSVSDTYSRFLIDEFLPALEAKHGLKLSTDPNDAAIAGNSSGGICAFMVGWHRPDRFRRVFSGVGTYVGIHGADQLPVLVRKYEPRPLRVYLQSGEHDNNLYCGDWWLANQTMERAFTWAGYDVAHTWGTDGHNAKRATAIFPDVLRWLWRDFSTAIEIKANPRGESKWVGYSVIGAGRWEVAWQRPRDEEGVSHIAGARYLAADANGNILAGLGGSIFESHKFGNGGEIRESELHYSLRVGGAVANRRENPGGLAYLPLGEAGTLLRKMKAGGRLFGVCAASGNGWIGVTGGDEPPDDSDRTSKISQFSKSDELPGSWKWKILANQEGSFNSSICSSFSRILYAASKDRFTLADWIRAYQLPDLNPVDDLDSAERFPPEIPGLSNICMSPDQSLIYATSSLTRFLYCCRVRNDGSLEQAVPFYQLELTDDGVVNAKGLSVDTNGWLYVATALGIQVCDQAGRVNFIIPTPQQPHDVCFGGKDLSSLFIACGDRIYQRQTKAHGIVSGQMPPIKPAPPKL